MPVPDPNPGAVSRLLESYMPNLCPVPEVWVIVCRFVTDECVTLYLAPTGTSTASSFVSSGSEGGCRVLPGWYGHDVI